jgi:hypothetical protein
MTTAELHKLIDELPDSAVEGAGVLLRGIIKGPIDPDQAWFWTPEWQEGEQGGRSRARQGCRRCLSQHRRFHLASRERAAS